jgi:adenylosuccinate synthase
MVGDSLRNKGNEFGSTTGRPRRCGWIDLLALRYSIMLNGVTQLVMTKADVLDSFESIKVAKAYERNGEVLEHFPFELSDDIKPVFIELPGWKKDISGIRKKSDFPVEFQQYIDFLEKELEVPITYVSVGPDREQIIKM